MYIRQIFHNQMEYRLQSMYNHMVGRTASVISPFYSLLPVVDPIKEYEDDIKEIVCLFDDIK